MLSLAPPMSGPITQIRFQEDSRKVWTGSGWCRFGVFFVVVAGLFLFSNTRLEAQEVGEAGVVEVDRFAPPACIRAIHAFARGLFPASDIPVLCPIPPTDEAVLLRGESEVPTSATSDSGLRLGADIDGSTALLGAGTSEWLEGTGWVYPGPESLDPPGSGLVLEVWGKRGRVATRIRGVTRSAQPFEGSHGSARVGPIRLWAGWRPVAFSWGRWGTVVLNQTVQPILLGFETIGGFRLPWISRVLGPANFFAFLGPSPSSGSVSDPLFSGARIQFAPASWFVLGASKALLFGGEGNEEPLTAGNVALALLGFTSQFGKSSDFENQVASIDALVRVRLGDRPAAVYGEWPTMQAQPFLCHRPFASALKCTGRPGGGGEGRGSISGRGEGERHPGTVTEVLGEDGAVVVPCWGTLLADMGLRFWSEPASRTKTADWSPGWV